MRERFFDGLLFLAFLLVGVKADAKSFGVVGEVFPLAEKSVLQLIDERLGVLAARGGENAHFASAVHSQMENKMNLLHPLLLMRTTATSHFYYTPEVFLKQALRNENGQVIYPAETRLNALEALPAYQPCWLFFNGEDNAQIRWAQKVREQCFAPKLILTEGSIRQAENTFQTPIYFDQGGFITTQLHIKTVPARVMRAGNQLRIDLFAIKENGDVV